MALFAERVADRSITPCKIQVESFKTPQIGKSMVKCVVYQKMTGICDRASLLWTGHNLATDQTEACFHAELV